MSSNIAVGVDIGGSHITAALVDLEQQAIIHSSIIRRSVHSSGKRDEILHEWLTAISDCMAHHSGPLHKIGLAMPGPFDYERGISFIKNQGKYDALYEVNVKKLLAQRLHVNPSAIFMMNDASCFLKGEVFAGAAAGCNRAIGFTLGTGLGSAAFYHGVVHDGDLYCTPFKNATAEDYLSTRWFIEAYKKQKGITVKNVKALHDRVSSDDVAQALFVEFGRNLGELVASYSKKWEAETVVLGGNICNAWELFMPATLKVLSEQAIHAVPRRAKLGEEAALLGAASLCV